MANSSPPRDVCWGHSFIPTAWMALEGPRCLLSCLPAQLERLEWLKLAEPLSLSPRGLSPLSSPAGLSYIAKGSPEITTGNCKVSSGLDLEVKKCYSCCISSVKTSNSTSRDPKGREIVFTSFWEVSGTPVQRWKESLAIVLHITYHKW